MSFIELSKELLNKTYTEKGDLAFISSGNAALDYFYMVGGKRNDVYGALKLFVKAFLEDANTALKLLLFTRDIKQGLGERNLFRVLLRNLAIYETDIAIKLVPYIAQYGRFDDLFILLHTEVEGEVIKLIQRQLKEDLENKKAGKPISLLAKWLPSINTSNEGARKTALYLAEKLGLSKADYRKTLSFLRKGLIIENNLREKDYSFSYESVPSVAMHQYRGAFMRNDKERFDEYIENVALGKKEMNIGVLDVVSFIKHASEAIYSKDKKAYFEATWKKLVEENLLNKRTLVVRDGSGSMYYYKITSSYSPIDVANALTLLTASRIQGEFADKFITFSARPELVDLSGMNSLFKKLRYLRQFDDISTTNIQSVYDLILNIYKHPDFKKEDALDQIMIVSDMEFDELDGLDYDEELSTFEYFKRQFAEIGYKMPELIFWNVASREEKVPVTMNEEGVKLVSGGSKNIIDIVLNTESINPLDFMKKVLERYRFIDEIMA